MYTHVPLHLDITQRVLPDEVPVLCQCVLPELKFFSSALLVEALCHAFGVDEDSLCLGVKNVLNEAHMEIAKTVDDWFLCTTTSRV